MSFNPITIPEPALYTHPVHITHKTDVDGGRLKHHRLIKFMHDARISLWAQNGWTEECMADDLGVVIGSLNINYLEAARFDDRVDIHVSVTNLVRKGFDVYYEVVRPDDQKVIARAQTSMIFIDMVHEKAALIPDEFRAWIQLLKLPTPIPEENTSSFFTSRL